MAGKSKRKVYRVKNENTGEHYTLRLSRESHEKMKETGGLNKFSKKLKKHGFFKLTKEIKNTKK